MPAFKYLTSSFGRISILIYHSTKVERNQRLAAEYELSTSAHHKSAISLPSSFKYLSSFTGVLNLGGAYLRSRQIQLLNIPTSWLTNFIGDADKEDAFLELVDAEWIVALNDWSNLFLATTFFLSGCFNLATVRQLRLRDQWAERILLPTPYKSCQQGGFQDEKMQEGTRSSWNSVQEREKSMKDGYEGEGKSFARAAPICSKRASVVGT
ncbi:hypothetical protein CVT25_004359 [Psilocybe cyanescens]|uniref:Uncharacterized protein n=1 Tax=Psilocybe cyanescens TaxID=93625 RepID=A0A409W4B7_PSICY|nr:hypothetical protein CVT25_004359 [Psilocybe cyanescens]